MSCQEARLNTCPAVDEVGQDGQIVGRLILPANRSHLHQAYLGAGALSTMMAIGNDTAA